MPVHLTSLLSTITCHLWGQNILLIIESNIICFHSVLDSWGNISEGIIPRHSKAVLHHICTLSYIWLYRSNFKVMGSEQTLRKNMDTPNADIAAVNCSGIWSTLHCLIWAINIPKESSKNSTISLSFSD